MKRRDDFEQFHRERKRRPLADISALHSKLHNSPRTTNTKKGPGIRISSLKQLETHNLPHKKVTGSSIFNIHRIIGKSQRAGSHGLQKSEGGSEDLETQFHTKNTQAKETAVDYNPVVASSNQIVQRFDSKHGIGIFSFSEKQTESVSKDSEAQGNDGNFTNGDSGNTQNLHTVVSVKSIGEYLLAVTLESGEVVLVIGRKGAPIRHGNTIKLGQNITYTINGAEVQVYFKWKVTERIVVQVDEPVAEPKV